MGDLVGWLEKDYLENNVSVSHVRNLLNLHRPRLRIRYGADEVEFNQLLKYNNDVDLNRNFIR